jgi:hypothetical protein
VVGGGAVVEDFGDYLREGLAGVDGDGVAGCQFVLDFGAPPVGPGGGVACCAEDVGAGRGQEAGGLGLGVQAKKDDQGESVQVVEHVVRRTAEEGVAGAVLVQSVGEAVVQPLPVVGAQPGEVWGGGERDRVSGGVFVAGVAEVEVDRAEAAGMYGGGDGGLSGAWTAGQEDGHHANDCGPEREAPATHLVVVGLR